MSHRTDASDQAHPLGSTTISGQAAIYKRAVNQLQLCSRAILSDECWTYNEDLVRVRVDEAMWEIWKDTRYQLQKIAPFLESPDFMRELGAFLHEDYPEIERESLDENFHELHSRIKSLTSFIHPTNRSDRFTNSAEQQEICTALDAFAHAYTEQYAIIGRMFQDAQTRTFPWISLDRPVIDVIRSL